MLKKIVICIALISCFLCFADDFNYETLKNPPKEVDCFDWQDGTSDLGWIPHSLTKIDAGKNGIFYCYPRIVRLSGKYKCQIRIHSSINYPKEIMFKYITGKTFVVPVKSKGTEKHNYGISFYVTCELSSKVFVTNFIKEKPSHIVLNIDSNKYELSFFDGWKKSFDLMKPFFKLDNAVQVQFR